MDKASGGRVTLRRLSGESAPESGGSVGYEGELSAAAGQFRVQAVVALGDGAVRFQAIGPAAPEWLLDVARTTLRSAWHAHQAGVSWPRRLSRWRASPSS